MIDLAIKAFIYTIICIQISINSSSEYKEFIYKTIKDYRLENEIRGECMSKQLNNNKIKQ